MSKSSAEKKTTLPSNKEVTKNVLTVVTSRTMWKYCLWNIL